MLITQYYLVAFAPTTTTTTTTSTTTSTTTTSAPTTSTTTTSAPTTTTTTTTTPTPTTTTTTTTTPAPGCIVVNTGNTSDMTYATLTSPDDGISYSNNSVAGTTTTTTPVPTTTTTTTTSAPTTTTTTTSAPTTTSTTTTLIPSTTTSTTPSSFTTTTTTVPIVTTTPNPNEGRGEFLNEFFINEYVYGPDGNIWKVVLISNYADNTYYTVETPSNLKFIQSPILDSRIYTRDQIVKVEMGSSFLNSLIDKKILEYYEMLNRLNEAKMRLWRGR